MLLAVLALGGFVVFIAIILIVARRVTRQTDEDEAEDTISRNTRKEPP
jgi:hypothetical protein